MDRSKLTADAPAVFFTRIARGQTPFVAPDIRCSSAKKVYDFFAVEPLQVFFCLFVYLSPLPCRRLRERLSSFDRLPSLAMVGLTQHFVICRGGSRLLRWGVPTAGEVRAGRQQEEVVPDQRAARRRFRGKDQQVSSRVRQVCTRPGISEEEASRESSSSCCSGGASSGWR